MDETGALFEEMETAVRPDLRVSTLSRWFTFRDLTYLFPAEMVLSDDVQGQFAYTRGEVTKVTKAPADGTAEALMDLLRTESSPVRMACRAAGFASGFAAGFAAGFESGCGGGFKFMLS